MRAHPPPIARQHGVATVKAPRFHRADGCAAYRDIAVPLGFSLLTDTQKNSDANGALRKNCTRTKQQQ
jgi:hypothetical protein